MTSALGHRIDELALVSNTPATSRDFLDTCLPTLAPGKTTEDFASVRFVEARDNVSPAVGPSGPFWKFTVFTDDVVRLRRTILANGVEVSDPVQFGTIGYLCHLREPGGIEIELLQRTFKDRPRPTEERADGLGLITLRVRDADRSAAFYLEELGLEALSEMAVDGGRADPFDLFFYGATEEDPPSRDLAHVDNREWLYQRSFTIIELQHYRRASDLDALTDNSGIGLFSVGVTNLDRPAESPDGHRFIPFERH